MANLGDYCNIYTFQALFLRQHFLAPTIYFLTCSPSHVPARTALHPFPRPYSPEPTPRNCSPAYVPAHITPHLFNPYVPLHLFFHPLPNVSAYFPPLCLCIVFKMVCPTNYEDMKAVSTDCMSETRSAYFGPPRAASLIQSLYCIVQRPCIMHFSD